MQYGIEDFLDHRLFKVEDVIKRVFWRNRDKNRRGERTYFTEGSKACLWVDNSLPMMIIL